MATVYFRPTNYISILIIDFLYLLYLIYNTVSYTHLDVYKRQRYTVCTTFNNVNALKDRPTLNYGLSLIHI